MPVWTKDVDLSFLERQQSHTRKVAQECRGRPAAFPLLENDGRPAHHGRHRSTTGRNTIHWDFTGVPVAVGVPVGNVRVPVGVGVSVDGTSVAVAVGVLVGDAGVPIGVGVFVGGTSVPVAVGVLVGVTVFVPDAACTTILPRIVPPNCARP